MFLSILSSSVWFCCYSVSFIFPRLNINTSKANANRKNLRNRTLQAFFPHKGNCARQTHHPKLCLHLSFAYRCCKDYPRNATLQPNRGLPTNWDISVCWPKLERSRHKWRWCVCCVSSTSAFHGLVCHLVPTFARSPYTMHWPLRSGIWESRGAVLENLVRVASTLIPPFYNIVIDTINIYYIRFPLSQQQRRRFHALNLRHDMGFALLISLFLPAWTNQLETQLSVVIWCY